MRGDKLVGGFLGLLLGSNLVAFTVATLKVIGKPYELILGESFLMCQADVIARGIPLYQRLTPSYFFAIPHTPLYVAVCGWISSITGTNLQVGRLVSLVCGIGVCVLVFLLIKHFTKNLAAGILGALLLSSTYVFRFLAPIYRMDSMCLLLSFLGIYWVVKFEGRGKLIYWAVPFFVASLFAKQYFIAAPIAVCIYLLVKNRRWTPSLKFGGVYGIVLLGSLLVAGLLTNWELIIHNFGYISIYSSLDWALFVGVMGKTFFFTGPLLLASLGYLGYKVYRKDPWTLLDVYFLVSLVVFLAACGKKGGGFHYSLEVTSVGCILVGFLLVRGSAVLRQKRVALVPLLLVGLLVVALFFQALGFPLGQGYVNYAFLASTSEGNQQTLDIVSETEGYIHADRIASPTVYGGHPEKWIAWEPALLFVGGIYKHKGRLGWDQSELVSRLETGYYELVITPHDLELVWSQMPGARSVHIYRERLSPEVAYAILSNYELKLKTERVGTNWCPWRHYIYEYTGNSEGQGD